MRYEDYVVHKVHFQLSFFLQFLLQFCIMMVYCLFIDFHYLKKDGNLIFYPALFTYVRSLLNQRDIENDARLTFFLFVTFV